MTRYARAQGSKSCNKKIPESGTPWKELKCNKLQAKNSKSCTSKSNVKRQLDNVKSCLKQRIASSAKSDGSNSWSVIETEDFMSESGEKQKFDGSFNSCLINFESKNSDKVKLSELKMFKQEDGDFTATNRLSRLNKFKTEPADFTATNNLSRLNKFKSGKGDFTAINRLSRRNKFKPEASDFTVTDQLSHFNKFKPERGDLTVTNRLGRLNKFKPDTGDFTVTDQLSPLNKFKPEADDFTATNKLSQPNKFKPEKGGCTATKRLSRLDKFYQEMGDCIAADDNLTTKKKKSENSWCFNCRKRGHGMIDCPEKKDATICYICGSTEHMMKSCRMKKSLHENFAFATCFICKEKGHISTSCPDNPSGLYPHGGACKGCGEVTHFFRDCPKQKSVDSSKTVTLPMIGNDVEGLFEDLKPTRIVKPLKKVNNVIF